MQSCSSAADENQENLLMNCELERVRVFYRNDELAGMLLQHKARLFWGAAGLLWSVEGLIHMRCGLQKAVYERENDCAGLPHWQLYLRVCEGICRSGLAVALAGFMWETGLAACRPSLRHIFRVVFLAENDSCNRCATVAKTGGTIIPLVVGLVPLCEEEALVPEWVAFCGHIFEILCHTVVTTALVGLLVDTCVAILKSQSWLFILNFVGCQDNIEAHGVNGDDTNAPEGELTEVPYHWPRATLMWIVFVLTLWGYCRDHAGGLPHAASTGLKVLGVLCWVGIVWSLIEYCGLGPRSGLLLHCLSSGASISNLAVAPSVRRWEDCEYPRNTRRRRSSSGDSCRLTGSCADP